MLKTPYAKITKMNQNGMSLILVLILLGIFSVMFLAVNRLIFWNRNMYNEIISTINIDDLNSQIYLLLQDRRACHNTFGGINRAAPPVAATIIRDAANVIAFQTNNLYVKNVTPVTMAITNFVSPVVGIEPYNATFDLTINYRIPFGESQKDKPRTFQIRTFAPAGWPNGTPLSRTSAPLAAITDGCVSAGDLAEVGVDLSDLISKNLPDQKLSNLIMNPINGVTSSILTVNGNATLNNVLTISDSRAKDDITPFELSDAQWEKIRGYSFSWKGSDAKDIGFMAQDVEKVIPELVDGTQADGYKRINYTAFIPLLLESTKKLDAENKIYEKRILDLETKLSNIKE